MRLCPPHLMLHVACYKQGHWHGCVCALSLCHLCHRCLCPRLPFLACKKRFEERFLGSLCRAAARLGALGLPLRNIDPVVLPQLSGPDYCRPRGHRHDALHRADLLGTHRPVHSPNAPIQLAHCGLGRHRLAPLHQCYVLVRAFLLSPLALCLLSTNHSSVWCTCVGAPCQPCHALRIGYIVIRSVTCASSLIHAMLFSKTQQITSSLPLRQRNILRSAHGVLSRQKQCFGIHSQRQICFTF